MALCPEVGGPLDSEREVLEEAAAALRSRLA